MDSLKEMTFFKSESSSSELANQFQMLLDKFCAHIKKEGLANATSYTQDSLDRFHTLPSDKKITIIKNFHDYYELCVECVTAGISLKDGRKMLWKLLPTLGLRPTSDLFDNLHDDHVIEVYRPDFTQVFRNIKFSALFVMQCRKKGRLLFLRMRTPGGFIPECRTSNESVTIIWNPSPHIAVVYRLRLQSLFVRPLPFKG